MTPLATFLVALAIVVGMALVTFTMSAFTKTAEIASLVNAFIMIAVIGFTLAAVIGVLFGLPMYFGLIDRWGIFSLWVIFAAAFKFMVDPTGEAAGVYY